MSDSTHDVDLKCQVVERDASRIEGDKRQYLPFVIEWVCPVCGSDQEEDFTKRYLSYPRFNHPYPVYVQCQDCYETLEDDEPPSYELTIIPRLSIEIVSVDGPDDESETDETEEDEE